MSWRKPEITSHDDFTNKEEDWGGKTFYWLPVTTVFGKPMGLEDAFKNLIKAASRDGVSFIPSPRMLFEAGAFSSKVYVEIEKPQAYNAQVITLEQCKVYSDEAIGDQSSIKKVIDRMKQKVESDGYPVQNIYQWYLTDPHWSLKKTSRTVVFVRV